MKNDATNTRTKKAITAERIFDILMDVRIRNRRGEDTSISQILKDNGFDQGLSGVMADFKFLAKEGREYKFNPSCPVTQELAEEILSEYNQRKAARAKSQAHIAEVEYEEAPLFKKEEPSNFLENQVVQLLAVARQNASTLYDIKQRLVRLETKTHSQGETVEAIKKDLALTIGNENMRVVKTGTNN